ncbi:MAG TPA: DNA polymerase III subunit alpha [Mycobacteriales bacterium]|nr:DNA polymerase III subunit alpha [Mycobacteriales bacterium]
MSDSFVHLHVHTEYSMLDGAARVKELCAAAAEAGMPALAMTDHGNLYGAYDFYSAARAAGVKPILGIEAYLAPGSRFDRSATGRGGAFDTRGDKYTHMTILAVTDQGWRNLVKLASLASLEGHYYKPRMDRELLASYREGLVATSGCPSSEVNRLFQQGNPVAARQALADYADIFGAGNFFVELMDHGLAIERQTQRQLIELAGELGLPLVATNDLHYTRQADSVAHEVLLCVQTGATLADPARFRFEADSFYLKSPAEMRSLWAELPEACENTLRIAERADVTLPDGGRLLPRFPLPDGETEESWFRAEVARGLDRRTNGRPSDEQRRQVAFETGVILEMGFPAYFLIVADLVRYARVNGIRVGPGRGSAAGCMVAWCLGITELDPMRHGLIFERFLNPERVSMPDIDMDFDDRRRGDMIRYATETYGEDRVAQIVTFGTIKGRQAIRDSARVLGFPYAAGDRLSKLLPSPVMGREMSLADCFTERAERFKEAAALRTAFESEPDARKILDTARGLEGLKRQAGVHAAGVVICRDPLTDHVPVWRREADGAVITQFDMGTCEKLGLLKMDFLGLSTLTVLDDCLRFIEANRGEQILLEELPLDNPEAYGLLCRGESIGVFQLEGGPMRSLMRSMQPSNFDDISALIALYRPGPMGVGAHIDYVERKHGRRPQAPIHPELAQPLADVLGETYGVIVYQEQVMAAAQKVAGYSLGQADLLRRAMSKKKKSILDKEYQPFAAGMHANGFSDGAIAKLWEVLVPFADYAFNKAHSAGYGLLSYWTAYLKARYPAEFMAALLTSVEDDKDRSAVYLHECRRMGIKVLPPDVNESDADFTPRGGDIRFGLSAIRNVGQNVVGSLIGTRRGKGRFADFADFLRKVEPIACNKKVVESLIKAGAFDSLGHTRRGLLQIHADALDACLETKRAEAIGQYDLFGTDPAEGPAGGLAPDIAIPLGEWDKPVLLAYEREMLGLYVSDHPLLGVEHLLAEAVDCSVASLSAEGATDGQIVTVGGIISALQRKVTKAGAPWALATLEDLEGAIEVMFFPACYQQLGHQLAEDTVLLVRGRVDRREDVPKLIAMDVSVPDLTQAPRGPVVITLPATRCTPPLVDRLKEVLATHPGTTEVRLQLQAGEKATVLRLDDRLRVSPTSALFGDLKALLGPAALGG